MPDLQKQIKQLWEMDDWCNSKITTDAGTALYQWLLRQKDDPMAHFLSGEGKKPEKDTSCDALRKKIIAHFTPLPEVPKYLEAFRAVVEHGNTKGLFDIIPPQISYFTKPEKSQFHQVNFCNQSKVQTWHKCLYAVQPATQQTIQQKIGRILLSAIINGGLLNTKSLSALYFKLGEPLDAVIPPTPDPRQGTSFVSYDLYISVENTPVKRLQRWFPDYFTEVLLLSFSGSIPIKKHMGTSTIKMSQSIFSCIKKYFQKTGLEKNLFPSSLTKLLDAVKSEQNLILPSFLLNYAAGKHLAHSPKEYVWKRLFGQMIPKVNQESELEADGINVDFETIDEEEPGYDYDASWAKELRTALKNQDRKAARRDVKEIVKKHEKNLYSFEHIMSGWIYFLISNKSSTGFNLSLSTIRGYLGRTGPRLADFIGNEDVTLLEGSALEEIYQQILANEQSPSYSNRIGSGLIEFHYYLVENFHVEPINFREAFGINTPNKFVDANFITFDEYSAILAEMEKYRIKWASEYHEDLTDIVKLIFMLGFRCGLRRSEVLKLTLKDLHLLGRAILIIRPNYARRLKTKSSVRTLPISVLLEEDELNYLSEWYYKRLEQESSKKFSPFLFSIPSALDEIAPEVKIFDIIHGIMRKVTGDMSLKFHHPRHSFATWLLCRFMLAHLDLSENIFPLHPITSKYLAEAKGFIQNLTKINGPSIKYLRAVASLLGHSSPETSISHYIHLTDIVLAATLRQKTPTPKHSAYVNAAFSSRSTCQRWMQQGGLELFMNNLRKNAPTERIQINKTVDSPTFVEHTPEDAYAYEDRYLYKVWDYLNLSAKQSMDQETIQTMLRLPKEKAIRMLNNAKYLTTIKPANSYRPRHPVSILIDPTSGLKIRMIGCPKKPRDVQENREVIKIYAPRIWKAFQEKTLEYNSIIHCFIHNSWSTRNDVIFCGLKDAPMARAYLKFLTQDLRIKKNQLSIVSFDPRQKSTARSKWRKELGLAPRDKISMATHPQGLDSQSIKEWIGIRPIFFPAPNTGSSAFRWTMLMSIICLEGSQLCR